MRKSLGVCCDVRARASTRRVSQAVASRQNVFMGLVLNEDVLTTKQKVNHSLQSASAGAQEDQWAADEPSSVHPGAVIPTVLALYSDVFVSFELALEC